MEETTEDTTTATDTFGIEKVTIKQSVSPDGRINSLSVEALALPALTDAGVDSQLEIVKKYTERYLEANRAPGQSTAPNKQFMMPRDAAANDPVVKAAVEIFNRPVFAPLDGVDVRVGQTSGKQYAKVMWRGQEFTAFRDIKRIQALHMSGTPVFVASEAGKRPGDNIVKTIAAEGE